MCWKNCVRECDENIQKSGRVGIGSCTMTMPPPNTTAFSTQQCLAKNEKVVVSHPLYSPDLAPYDFFFCNHGWSRIWKVGALPTLRRFIKNRWQSLTEFPLKILDNVSSSGSRVGIAHPVTEGVLGRRLKCQTCMNIVNKFFVLIPEIFGSPPHRPHSQPGHSGDERSLLHVPGTEPQFLKLNVLLTVHHSVSV
jgi:hypothetical protein